MATVSTNSVPPFITAAVKVLGSLSELDAFVAAMDAAGAASVAALVVPHGRSFKIDGALIVDGIVVTPQAVDTALRAARGPSLPALTALASADSPAQIAALAQAQLFGALQSVPAEQVGPFLDALGAVPSPGIDEVAVLITGLADAPTANARVLPNPLIMAAGTAGLLAIALVAFLVLRGGTDDSSTAPTSTAAVDIVTETITKTEVATTALEAPESTTEPDYTASGNVTIEAGDNYCVVYSDKLMCDIGGRELSKQLPGCDDNTGPIGANTSAAMGTRLIWSSSPTCVTAPSDLPTVSDRISLGPGQTALLSVGDDQIRCSRFTDDLVCVNEASDYDGFEIDEIGWVEAPLS